MLILSNKKFEFTSDQGQKFCTRGGKIIEEAPEWIKDTWLYGLAVSDGDLVEVKGSSDADADVAVAKTRARRAKKSVEEISERPPEEVPEP